jgi:hypothetical protein
VEGRGGRAAAVSTRHGDLSLTQAHSQYVQMPRIFMCHFPLTHSPTLPHEETRPAGSRCPPVPTKCGKINRIYRLTCMSALTAAAGSLWRTDLAALLLTDNDRADSRTQAAGRRQMAVSDFTCSEWFRSFLWICCVSVVLTP